MELKSFGNMYYLDENGDTLVYPKTQFRWEWKSKIVIDGMHLII